MLIIGIALIILGAVMCYISEKGPQSSNWGPDPTIMFMGFIGILAIVLGIGLSLAPVLKLFLG